MLNYLSIIGIDYKNLDKLTKIAIDADILTYFLHRIIIMIRLENSKIIPKNLKNT